MKPCLALDFDGVLNNYLGWNGEDGLSTPREGVELFLQTLYKKYDIVIFTCRDPTKVREWLKKYKMLYMIKQVTTKKPKAVAYIDDRAINFTGSYLEVLEKLENFEVYWRKE